MQRTEMAARTPLQMAAGIVGLVFLLVGIAGFIPGVTENFDAMEAAGPDSNALLLGLFEVSILHNIVHLLFGVLGLAAARRSDLSKMYLIVGGLTYLALWLYGMAIDLESTANFVPFNNADNWLHLGLGTGMAGLGVLLAANEARDGNRTRSTAPGRPRRV